VATVVTDLFANLDAILTSLTVLFPGFVSYFVYVGLRTAEFERIKRSHLVLILFFTLFFQIVGEYTVAFSDHALFPVVYYLLLPISLGAVSDLSHRFFVTVIIDEYQDRIVEKSLNFKLTDVGNVPRWQKTIKDYLVDSLGDITLDYYIEVDPIGDSDTISGFLNGYSEDDIEIIRYDDLSEKSFEGIGDPDIDNEKLTLNVEIIRKSEIRSIRIYRVKMEDFELN